MAEADPTPVKIVNVHDAKTHLSKLLKRAHAGEEIILGLAGKPYARLVPLASTPKPQREPGILKDYTVPDCFFDPLPDDELDAWEGKYSSF